MIYTFHRLLGLQCIPLHSCDIPVSHLWSRPLSTGRKNQPWWPYEKYKNKVIMTPCSSNDFFHSDIIFLVGMSTIFWSESAKRIVFCQFWFVDTFAYIFSCATIFNQHSNTSKSIYEPEVWRRGTLCPVAKKSDQLRKVSIPWSGTSFEGGWGAVALKKKEKNKEKKEKEKKKKKRKEERRELWITSNYYINYEVLFFSNFSIV